MFCQKRALVFISFLRHAYTNNYRSGTTDLCGSIHGHFHVPTHSNTASAPSLWVSSITLAIASSPRSAIISVAPRTPGLIFAALRIYSMAMIRVAPSNLAPIIPQRPTAPSPMTTTVEPSTTSADFAAWKPVAMTSAKAKKEFNVVSE